MQPSHTRDKLVNVSPLAVPGLACSTMELSRRAAWRRAHAQGLGRLLPSRHVVSLLHNHLKTDQLFAFYPWRHQGYQKLLAVEAPAMQPQHSPIKVHYLCYEDTRFQNTNGVDVLGISNTPADGLLFFFLPKR